MRPPGKSHRVQALFVRVLRVLERRMSALTAWSLSCSPEALCAELQLDGENVSVRAIPRADGPCYATTPSLQISLGPVRRGAPLNEAQEHFLRLLVTLLRRADPGNLRFPEPPDPGSKRASDQDKDGVPSEGDPPPAEVPERDDAAHRRWATDLHWSSFLGYEMLLSDDLYPHVAVLGEPLERDELVDGWRQTIGRIRGGTAPQNLGLYVHIPFCAKVCSYCFCLRTDALGRAELERYTAQLKDEADFFGPLIDGQPLTSAYFGGGTPSLLSSRALAELFDLLWSRFQLPASTQVVFEGNPDSLNARKIAVLARQGHVTRLTVGVQSLDEDVGDRVNRHNTHERVRRAVQVARDEGITVNCDLIAGLPEQTLDSFKRDLDFLIEIGADSVHINQFRPLPWTPYARDGGKLTAEDVERRRQMYDWGQEVLACEDLDSEQNTADGLPVNTDNVQEFDLRRQNSSLLGLGYPAYSHAFASHYYQPVFRTGFQTSLQRDMGEPGRQWEGVRVDALEEQHKYLVRNFRAGWSRAEFQQLFGCDCVERHDESLQRLTELGVLRVQGDRVRTFTRNVAEVLTYSSLLFSEKLAARAREVLASRYDPDTDYQARIRDYVGQE